MLFVALVVAAGVAASTPESSGAGLTVNYYGNSALHGTPMKSETASTLELSLGLSAEVGSVEVTGTVAYDKDSMYSFDCNFAAGTMVFVWLRDHLICHTDPPFGNSPSSTDGCPEYPLPGKAGEVLPLVMHVYNLNSTADSAKISVEWAHLAVPLPAGAKPKTTAIPSHLLTPTLPASEVQRRALQDDLKNGWCTWSYNMLGVVRLPESSTLTTALCKISTKDCLVATHIEDPKAQIRVGVFATDASYWQFYLGYAGINVSMSYAGGTGDLNVLAEPQNCGTGAGQVDCSDYALVALPRWAWFRNGKTVINNATGTIQLSPMGMPTRTVTMTSPAEKYDFKTFEGYDHIAVSFGKGNVGMQESATTAATAEEAEAAMRAAAAAPPTAAAIAKVIAAARAKEFARYSKYGELADVKEAVQAATMWNYIYTPAEYGPFLPVSRQWNFVQHGVNLDWAYVIFDWDNIFASYMTSLDPRSKEIAYSNFIQVIRSRTAQGFVPNFSAGGSKSIDRSEPPIGAKVLLQMHQKYNDTWLVDLLYDDLVAWNDWFVRERMFGPLGIVSLGSDTIAGYTEYAPGQMQGARFESGLDNSPMYDGEMFNKSVKSIGSYTIGQMELYDVGFASMFVSEAESLATLAGILGKADDITKFKARAASQRALIKANLWDAEGGIYTNLRWNGSFYRRISPTSFYSMMSGAPTDDQAEAMVKNWLHNPDHFCIAPNGDFAGNKDTCYWGLPSIQASDPAFPPLGYWRGYVWGPMAQLTYWSLQDYDHVPAVRSGRKALCKQMTALMRSQWREHRHICENYSPHKTADDHHGDCSGTKFYHWGALTGMITLIEEGFY